MDTLNIKYSTSGKALPPRPIRLQLPGWAGSPEMKMENGSEPQPWHCPPFVEGAAYGLELLYHYENECHVINESGDLRIDWDYASEPGGVMGPDEFGIFAPRPNKFYFIASLIDIQAPPGYVIRTQPHPRFYTDDTGTVPAAVVGHVQTDWWPKKLFVVMKAPPPGQRHIFRKGDPYVQLIFVPQRAAYELTPMTPQEQAARRETEQHIAEAKTFIAKSVWQNPGGSEFNDHYRTLARAFAKGGAEEMSDAVDEGVRRLREVLPSGKSIPEYLELAYQFQNQGKYLEAREVLFHVRRLDPQNPEAASRLGIVAGSMGLPELAVKMMSEAVTLRPEKSAYHNNLGVALRRLQRLADAERAFRGALALKSDDPLTMSNLGLTVAEQGREEEGLQLCRAALAVNDRLPAVHCRAALVLTRLGRLDEARASYNAALAVDPGFAAARAALQNLDLQTDPAR